ncbi:MAG: DUF2461 domain-containing protein [Chloroflexota bacterium]
MTAVPAFEGFDPEAINFLADLAANNDRAWFTPRKGEYERLLKRPLEGLCAALAERFEARGIPLTADPARSPFRIYRDTRFAKDKSPYKSAASAQFPAVGGGPAGYIHIEPGEIFAGGGLYRPEQPVLVAWRTLVDTRPDEVHAALEDPGFVAAYGGIYGDRLKRVPAPYAKDHPDADLLTLKDLIFRSRLSDADIHSPGLPDLLVEMYTAAMPVIGLLGRVAGAAGAAGA